MTILRLINGILWIILGILIAVWLIFPIRLLELFIWSGFVIGCVLVGILEIKVYRDDIVNE